MIDNNKLENLQNLISKLFNLGFSNDLSAEVLLVSSHCLLINIIGKYSSLFDNNFRLQRDIRKILTLMIFNDKNNTLDHKLKVLVDVNGEKLKNIEFLKSIAKENAEKVLILKRSIGLNYMNAFERYIVHDYISHNYPNLQTYSEGKEPKRKIIISIKE